MLIVGIPRPDGHLVVTEVTGVCSDVRQSPIVRTL